MAFTLRKQGYDVEGGHFQNGLSDDEVSAFFKNAPGFTYAMAGDKFYDPRTENSFGIPKTTEIDPGLAHDLADKLTDTILDSTPDGGYGILNGSHYATGLGTAHSIAYEVEDGRVKYYDGQIKESYDDTYDMVEKNCFTYDSCRVMRTDNLEPDWLVIAGDHRIERPD